MPDAAPDPADAIAAALARLRGRRLPRPPWEQGPDAHGSGRGGGPFGRWDPDVAWPRGGPHHAHGDPHDAHAHAHGHGGPPPWMGGGRFGGPARLRLLEALAAASHALSVGEIGDAIGVDQPRASRLVQQCAELGLVRREADPDDARRTRVALTDRGDAIVRGFRGERRDAIGAALASFTDAERAELARLLTKLAESWPRS